MGGYGGLEPGVTHVTKGKIMRATHCKRSVVLGSALILALAPVSLQQASAGTPSETHASAPTAVNSPRDYQRGYRVGFRDGYRDARDDCSRDYGIRSDSANRDWTRGYRDGYSDGYARAERRYC
jgi:hypothetical protein